MPYVKEVLEAMCIPILEVAGYEADDVIGTLSQKGADAGYDVYMVTPTRTTASWCATTARFTSRKARTESKS